MNKVICIVGPTASGKTALSIELATRINGEIISADSMQIYKNLDVATAKVTKEEMQGIKHYCLDIVDMDAEFSVADFKKLCYKAIEDIISRNKTPIIVGGTGLYMSSVIYNMNFLDEDIDEEYRNQLYDLANKESNEFVHNILKKVDYNAAQNIHPNNLKRVIRALEMHKNSIKKSDHIDFEKHRIETEKPNFEFKLFCIEIEKNILHQRINLRVENMFVAGLEKEAKVVYNLEKGTAKQAVGYKEFFDYFENKKTLKEVEEEIKLRTRQYAKRQMTWFKKMKNVNYLNGLHTKEKMIEEIMVKVYEES